MDREFFGIIFDVLGPGPLENASEKIALRSFCTDFRAEISHSGPNSARDNFQTHVISNETTYIFYKHMISTSFEEIDLL